MAGATRRTIFALAVLLPLAALDAADAPKTAGAPVDPLGPILSPHLKSMVDVVLENYGAQRKYTDEDFPMSAEQFDSFRREIVDRLAETLLLQDWTVRNPRDETSPIAHLFADRVLKTIEHHGVSMEIHAVEFPDSGLVVPMVLCLPEAAGERPGVCVYSGHTAHGLRDLVLDLNSYQRGAAVRLARAGFATIAVEKIDTGYLSRDGNGGVDENDVTTTLLHWGQVTRGHQLKACLAAAEILAAHPRVDENRIGATGVSLGGWLSIQTALLSDRVAAVADFGRKTLAIPPGTTADTFSGQRDLCHILPGMLSLCDRNVLALAYAPRPLLAGHGRKDTGSHREGPVHYERLFREQYATLGHGRRFTYLVHEGGDDLPVEAVIAWFKEQFDETE